ncbi:hypothetical protein [Cutibacterium granulosum]|uniref:hypothetical protein n=1 Tax=Cutibacterium granulosum TaxID=33011 RepID=UPI00257421E2|nr:hypothetical protein [Cutibacterium granulosum]MEA5642211.1 hypothetical protein [Cutibacterium granulosum]MEA5645678.1 hypothetical protein [Cutibacterium granulosum]BDQ41045.1 hypothetical protein TPCG7_16940 [Cutibacterium granulosum]
MTDHIITSNFSSLTSSDGHLTELDPFDLTDCAGDFVDDFDMDAASDDYYEACCEALAAVRPEWSLLKDAEVIGPVDSPDLDEDERATLGELLDTIDVTAILQRHAI